MCISIDKYASTARKNILHNLPAQFRISERRSALQPLMNEMANYYYFQSFISAGPSTASPGLQHRNTISPPSTELQLNNAQCWKLCCKAVSLFPLPFYSWLDVCCWPPPPVRSKCHYSNQTGTDENCCWSGRFKIKVSNQLWIHWWTFIHFHSAAGPELGGLR